MENRRINCHKCEYFFVTWEPRFPYGCSNMGFKSKILPSLEVFKASGEPCRAFELKKRAENKKV